MLITRGCGHFMMPWDKPFAPAPQIQIGKDGDIMSKINTLSTLFIGIDVSSKSNVIYAMDFEQNKLLSGSFPNNQPGAEALENAIRECMHAHQNLDTIVAALESTSV